VNVMGVVFAALKSLARMSGLVIADPAMRVLRERYRGTAPSGHTATRES
jgi:hypothetical protein